MNDIEALAGRLEAQDRLIALLLVAVVEGQVVSRDSVIATIERSAEAAATSGNHRAATILRHRAKALRAR